MSISAQVNNSGKSKRDQYSEFEDDRLLILIASRRDSDALAALYERYRVIVGRFLQRGMCETMLVEEVYNDVMLAVWRKASSFRGDSKVSTWIFSIAYYIRCTHAKKESRYKHDVANDSELSHEGESETGSSLRETIQDAMMTLSEAHRMVIELSYFHGYKTSEIAVIVDCPQNTVKTRLFHARKKLKETLQSDLYALRSY